MADYNITMKQLNSSGTYDTLYPATIGSQVTGITGDQISGIYTADQTLTSATAALFGLGADAVPDEVFALLAHSRISAGKYVGNASSSIFVDVGFNPYFVLVLSGRQTHYRDTSVRSGVAFRDDPFEVRNTNDGKDYTALEISGNGFRAYYKEGISKEILLNIRHSEFSYIAFGE